MEQEWLALSYDDSQAIFEFFDEVDRVLAEALLAVDLSEAERADWEGRLGSGNRRRAANAPPPNASPSKRHAGLGFEPIQRVENGASRIRPLGRRPAVAPRISSEPDSAFSTPGPHRGVPESGGGFGPGRRLRGHARRGGSNRRGVGTAGVICTRRTKHSRWPQPCGTTTDRKQPWNRPARSNLGRQQRASSASRVAPRPGQQLGESELPEAHRRVRRLATLAATATEELAGEEWPTVREELLERLQTRTRDSGLRNGTSRSFCTRSDRRGHRHRRPLPDYKVVEPVVETVWEEHPHWTIDA